MQAQAAAAAAQEGHHPGGAHRLRQNGGQGGAPDAHAQDKDKDGVQNDVQNGPDEHAEHGGGGPPLGADEGIEAQGQLDKDGAQQIDADILLGVADGGVGRTEGVQDGLLKDAESHGQDHCRAQQHGEGVAQDALRLHPPLRPQLDGGQGGAPLPRKGGKGGDQGDDGEGDPHAGEGHVPDLRDVADIDAVHNVIEHVDDLSRDRGHRQLQNQFPNGGGGQDFIAVPGLFHRIPLPFLRKE